MCETIEKIAILSVYFFSILCSVVDPDPDPDPYWIRIQSGLWIRIRRNPDPDPGGQK
jgi:hypothetical protein